MKITLTWTGTPGALQDALEMISAAWTRIEEDNCLSRDVADEAGIEDDEESTIVLGRYLIETLSGRDFPCDEGEDSEGRFSVEIGR